MRCFASLRKPPERWARRARISARIESAVSSCVSAPMSSPLGPMIRSSASSETPASSSRSRLRSWFRRDLRHRVVRPRDDELVGRGNAFRGRELPPRVGDDRLPAEQLRATAERLGGVDRAVDEEARRRPVPLAEDLRAVVERQHAGPPPPKDLVGLRSRLLVPLADALAGLEHEQLRADAVALDDGEQDSALARLVEVGEAFDELHSTRSTNTSISPPQGRP